MIGVRGGMRRVRGVGRGGDGERTIRIWLTPECASLKLREERERVLVHSSSASCSAGAQPVVRSTDLVKPKRGHRRRITPEWIGKLNSGEDIEESCKLARFVLV